MKKFWSQANTKLALTTVALGASVGRVFAQNTGGNLGSILQPQIEGRSLASWEQLIPQIITLVFIVAAALTFFYLIAGAIKWITSGGDKGKVEEARGRITAAVIGLLILAAVWAVFQLLVQVAFGTNVEDINLPNFTQ